LTWRPTLSSMTFHGRDVMAPALAMLMQKRPIPEIARPLNEPVLLDLYLASDWREASIIHIDAFGNATTNLPEAMLANHRDAAVIIGNQILGPIRGTYSDVGIGQPLALIGSSGLLEIAVREGSAAELLMLNVGDAVLLR
jgi:S-adenosylmethionine hydrolase